MALNCKHNNPLQHDGTSQFQRFLKALEPGNVPIHEFDLRDWMRFAWYFAEHLNYFSNTDNQLPQGNWQDFMKSTDEIKEWLRDAVLVQDEKWISQEERDRIMKREPKGDYEPHLALFLSFLKLMKFPKEHLNGVTKRHLDFYYTRVLQLGRQPAVPDRVYILFELAKNAVRETVPSGSRLDAGKDGNGKQLCYVTEEEITVNTATVALMKSIFHQDGATVRYAEMTNSVDGLGSEFKGDNPCWNAFGNKEWPVATLGFALASAVLLMKEGNREITVSLTLKTSGDAGLPTTEQYMQQLNVFLSGEKEWMAVTVTEVTTVNKEKLEFKLKVDTSEKAVVPYDSKIHGERFSTNLPIMRVLVNTSNKDGYLVYAALSRAVIKEATITVLVKEARDIAVENDQGKLDPSKPFYPFGSIPKKDSCFYIGSPEIFQKKWNYVKLDINWKDKPGKLSTHYSAYKTTDGTTNGAPSLSGTAVVTGEEYFTVIPQYIKDNKWSQGGGPLSLFTSLMEIKPVSETTAFILPTVPPLLMKKGIDINKAVLQSYLNPPVQMAGNTVAKKPLAISAKFESARFNPGFPTLATTLDQFSPATKSGYIRLMLQQGFLHDLYVPLMMLFMIDKSKIDLQASDAKPQASDTKSQSSDAKLAREPYTPVIASMTVEYQATAQNSFVFYESAQPKDKYDDFTARAIQLFHEHPFGQAEQHLFLKEQCDFIDPTSQRNIALVPSYSPEGEFYIGLKSAQPSGLLSLLLEAEEGSEDPLAPTFGKEQKIAWYALSNNEWKALNRDFLIADSTNNLLRSGIVTFLLPASINESNTLLDSGYLWLKASLPVGLIHTSVCQLAGVFAQAAAALFADNGNELSHLSSALPASTIVKIIDKPALIKGISQPFASFGGVTAENDNAFYLRVSERLRHKQRAVTLWDYERLVLQQYPSVYKVKCLSHTSALKEDGTAKYCEQAPGSVSLVVIPDIRNKNIFDPLQPRASQNLLREIENFINNLNSLHIKFDAINPDYETVLLDFRVKFYDRYDANAYRKVLNDDIVRYLSPWAFGDFSDIHFGGKLFKSVIIRFLEERKYVDFVSHFKMYHRVEGRDNNMTDCNEITARSARAILVSAPEHTIVLIEKGTVCYE